MFSQFCSPAKSEFSEEAVLSNLWLCNLSTHILLVPYASKSSLRQKQLPHASCGYSRFTKDNTLDALLLLLLRNILKPSTSCWSSLTWTTTPPKFVENNLYLFWMQRLRNPATSSAMTPGLSSSLWAKDWLIMKLIRLSFSLLTCMAPSKVAH